MGKLVANVNVDGTWYGPDHDNADDVPAEVAEQITNPDAWEDGKAPETGTRRTAAKGKSNTGD